MFGLEDRRSDALPGCLGLRIVLGLERPAVLLLLPLVGVVPRMEGQPQPRDHPSTWLMKLMQSRRRDIAIGAQARIPSSLALPGQIEVEMVR